MVATMKDGSIMTIKEYIMGQMNPISSSITYPYYTTSPYPTNVKNTRVTMAASGGGGNISSYINEVIYYQEVLPESAISTIESYLAWKWGFQTAAGGSLAMSHPYSLSFPTLPAEIAASAATASAAIASAAIASAAIPSAAIASAAMASAAYASGQMASAAQASAQIASGQMASAAYASAQIASGQQASAQRASAATASAAYASGQRASGQIASGQQASAATASGQMASAARASAATASTALGIKSMGQDPDSGEFLLLLEPL